MLSMKMCDGRDREKYERSKLNAPRLWLIISAPDLYL